MTGHPEALHTPLTPSSQRCHFLISRTVSSPCLPNYPSSFALNAMGNRGDDLFDGLLHLEGSFIEKGRAEGVQKGKELGHLEGAQLGVVRGFEVGSELSFYRAVCDVLLAVHSAQPEMVPPRAMKTIDSLQTRVAAFPSENIVDADLLQDLQRIRASFRVITSLMRLALVFNPRELQIAKENSF